MSDNNNIKLTDKQEKFCNEYLIDLNATQAAVRSGYSENTAKEIGCENLTKPNIQYRITELKEELSKKVEVTPEMLTLEWKKIAFSSIAHYHKTWIDRTDFEQLTQDQKDAIQGIETRVIKKKVFADGKDKEEIVDVEQVKISLYSKEKALENLGKRVGYYEINNKQKTEKEMTPDEREKLINELINRANRELK